MEAQGQRRVILGRIAGAHGVRGWVKVVSHTEPRANILAYERWQLRRAEGWQSYAVAEGQGGGGRVLARLEGVSTRDEAAALTGADVAVLRDELPAPAEGEYYWTDLEGMTVRDLAGRVLGCVQALFSTGANDVMVVRGDRERLLPFVHGTVVKDVDLAAREIRVDWDADL
jgi:16S rRNA processing protein RimM